MEYFLIIVLQLLGVGLHVMQKVSALDRQYTEMTKRQIWGTFFDQDWTTLVVSAIIICLNVVAHHIVDEYTPELRTSINYYILYAFALAFLLGYCGQRVIYKYLGSAEKFLDKKVEDKLN